MHEFYEYVNPLGSTDATLAQCFERDDQEGRISKDMLGAAPNRRVLDRERVDPVTEVDLSDSWTFGFSVTRVLCFQRCLPRAPTVKVRFRQTLGESRR